jgi:transposase-like protein
VSKPSKFDAAKVRAALSVHITIVAAAKALGVDERTLRNWLAQHPELVATRQASLRRATRKLSKGA